METIVCQYCDRTIDHVDSHKVSILYSICTTCKEEKPSQEGDDK